MLVLGVLLLFGSSPGMGIFAQAIGACMALPAFRELHVSAVNKMAVSRENSEFDPWQSASSRDESRLQPVVPC